MQGLGGGQGQGGQGVDLDFSHGGPYAPPAGARYGAAPPGSPIVRHLIFLTLGLILSSLARADDRAAFFRVASRHTPAAHPEPAYHFQADLLAAEAALLQRWPGRVSVERVGDTVQGRPIWAFTVRDPGHPVHHKLLVFAQIHALEWIGTEVALDFLVEVAAHPPPGVAVTVIPVLNADGRAKVEFDLKAGDDVYRRGNAPNVDLNRDFAVNREATAIWRHLIPRRYATSPAPLSQPESQAIDALADRERFDVAVSLHAYGGYIYYPWAGLWERPPDRDDFEALGRVFEAGMTTRTYRTQQLSRWAFFFRGHGMEIDHLYGQYGTRAFLVELTRTGRSLWRPRTWKPRFRIYNPEDPQREVNRAVPGLTALARHLGGLTPPGSVLTGACREARAPTPARPPSSGEPR